MNKEIQKIKKVDIEINDSELIVRYLTMNDFDQYILKNWNKAVLVPMKIAKHLHKKYKFIINEQIINYKEFMDQILIIESKKIAQ